jgi:NAD(P)-dependent dehydrogenase (short-subunit alcohol dehydrogenase family)
MHAQRHWGENLRYREEEKKMNHAGSAGHLGMIREHDPADYEAVFAVNVQGTFLCMSAGLRNMRVAKGNVGGSSIVNAASMAGLVGNPN